MPNTWLQGYCDSKLLLEFLERLTNYPLYPGCILTLVILTLKMLAPSSPETLVSAYGNAKGHAIPQAVAGFPSWRPMFDPRSGHVELVVDKVALGWVFSKYFSFLYEFSSHQLLRIH
jgi:hypothetical protein